MRPMQRRHSIMLVALVLGFGGAGMTGACVGEIGPNDAACPAPSVDPPIEKPSDCSMSTENQCMLYRIPLMGNPSTDAMLRAKYVAAFGSACYVSAANTFDCFYKDHRQGCGHLPGVLSRR